MGHFGRLLCLTYYIKLPSLIHLAFKFFDHFNVQNITPENVVAHFTDLLRTFLLPTPVSPLKRTNEITKLQYSAMQLHEVGKCLLDIKFNLKNRVLKVTCLELYDWTKDISPFNMLWHQRNFVMGKTYALDPFGNIVLVTLFKCYKNMYG